MASKKKPILDLPVKLIFTETGVSFFIRSNKKLNRFTMADNTEQYGISLAKFSPASLQNMMLIGYITKIEISRPEFMSKRSDLMDLAKLICFGFLYKQFDEEVLDLLIHSDTILEWNRNNPGSIIDKKTKVNEKVLAQVIEKNKQAINSIRRNLSRSVYDWINKNPKLQVDEKNIQIFLTDKFLNNLRPFSWFIMTKFSSSLEYDTVYEELKKKLVQYIQKSSIAEYLALMLMELCISAENINMKAFVKKKYKGAISYESLVFDPEKRAKLMHEMERDEANLSVAWRIGARNETSIGTSTKLEVSVYNKETEYDALRNKMNETISSDGGSSLSDFYQTSDVDNTEMGMNYLTYLMEECNKVGIHFTSRVNQIRGGEGMSFITLQLQF